LNDRIFVDNLRLSCRIGITPEERKEPQEVLVDVSLSISLAVPGKSDSLSDSLDYRQILQRVSTYGSSREFTLIEGLAEGIASLMLETFPADRVSVRVRKAKYSSEPSIGVELVRDRN
jgi:dihydroneopterin aldolase